MEDDGTSPGGCLAGDGRYTEFWVDMLIDCLICRTSGDPPVIYLAVVLFLYDGPSGGNNNIGILMKKVEGTERYNKQTE